MATNTMQVEVVSPEKVIFTGEATMVITRTLGGGEIAFLPGHAPFLGALAESHTRIMLVDGTTLHAAVHGGFVQVSDNKVSILSDIAELAEDIDRPRAIDAMERAEAILRNTQDADAVAALSRAHARLAATGGVSGTTAGAH
jgi:F-type H+-transporting ATPase subunit epsilon